MMPMTRTEKPTNKLEWMIGQLIKETNQLNVNLVQAWKLRPFKLRDSSSIICYICNKQGNYVKDCVKRGSMFQKPFDKKNYYLLPFINNILSKIFGHRMYSFGDGYNNYNQIKIFLKKILNITFTTTWDTFVYIVIPFELCNALGNILNVHEQNVGKLHWTFCLSVLKWLLYVHEVKNWFRDLKSVFDQLVMVNVSSNPKICWVEFT